MRYRSRAGRVYCARHAEGARDLVEVLPEDEDYSALCAACGVYAPRGIGAEEAILRDRIAALEAEVRLRREEALQTAEGVRRSVASFLHEESRRTPSQSGGEALRSAAAEVASGRYRR